MRVSAALLIGGMVLAYLGGIGSMAEGIYAIQTGTVETTYGVCVLGIGTMMFAVGFLIDFYFQTATDVRKIAARKRAAASG